MRGEDLHRWLRIQADLRHGAHQLVRDEGLNSGCGLPDMDDMEAVVGEAGGVEQPVIGQIKSRSAAPS